MVLDRYSDENELKKIKIIFDDNEIKNRKLGKTCRDGLLIVNTKGKILYSNDAYLNISGYSLDELLTMSIIDLTVIGISQDRSLLMHKIIRTKGHDRFENYHRKKDGTVYPVESIIYYLDIGDGLLFGFIVDFTETSKMEKFFESNDKKFYEHFENASDFISIQDIETGCIIDINPAAYKCLGYSKNELVGEHLSKIISPENPESFNKRIVEIQENGSAIFESKYLHKNGSLTSLEVNSRLLKKENKFLEFSIARDITDHKNICKFLAELEKQSQVSLKNQNK